MELRRFILCYFLLEIIISCCSVSEKVVVFRSNLTNTNEEQFAEVEIIPDEDEELSGFTICIRLYFFLLSTAGYNTPFTFHSDDPFRMWLQTRSQALNNQIY